MYVNVKNISIDSPKQIAFQNDTGKSGGDHENIYGKQFSWSNVHEKEGMGLYGDCKRKAVHIRERFYWKPWFSSKNPMIFSHLTTKKHFDISEEDYVTIEYKKTVDSSNG